jgi:hypothetical protein
MLQATGREFAPPADEVFMVGFGGAVFSGFVLSVLDAGLRLHWLSPAHQGSNATKSMKSSAGLVLLRLAISRPPHWTLTAGRTQPRYLLALRWLRRSLLYGGCGAQRFSLRLARHSQGAT